MKTVEMAGSDEDVNERVYAAPKRMAAPRSFMFFFCGGGNNIIGENYESRLAEQRCSVPCVTFCFINFETFKLLTRRLTLEYLWLLAFDCAFRISIPSIWLEMNARASAKTERLLCVNDESLDTLGWCALVPPLIWVPRVRVGMSTFKKLRLQFRRELMT